jgi:Xaa-Pro aminopeptidase
MDYADRQQRLRRALLDLNIQAILVTHLPNIRYLCGFTGSSGVLACRLGHYSGGIQSAFFTDGRYTQQARDEVRRARVVIANKPVLPVALEWLAGSSLARLAIEADHLTVAELPAIKKGIGRGTRVEPTTHLIARLRMVKERDELKIIRKAALLGASLFDVARRNIRPGVTESSVAAAMEHAARKAGAEAMSFDTIVASGKRSAMPHGRASQARVPRRGFCILDFGVILAGYCSDMTRTLYVGAPDRRATAMYDVVREAQLAGVGAVRAGATAEDIDRAARGVLEKAGFGRFFTHSTGHGVGLEIHEPPRLGEKQPDVLQPGMVITIEPGIYVPGSGGVRIEDMVVVTERGCEVLTPTTKDLIVI